MPISLAVEAKEPNRTSSQNSCHSSNLILSFIVVINAKVNDVYSYFSNGMAPIECPRSSERRAFGLAVGSYDLLKKS